MSEVEYRLESATGAYITTAVFPSVESPTPELFAWEGRFFIATGRALVYRECKMALVTKTRET